MAMDMIKITLDDQYSCFLVLKVLVHCIKSADKRAYSEIPFDKCSIQLAASLSLSLNLLSMSMCMIILKVVRDTKFIILAISYYYSI